MEPPHPRRQQALGWAGLGSALPWRPFPGGRGAPNSRGQDRAGLQGEPALQTHLEATHVSGIPCVLQAVLVAFEEELEEEPEKIWGWGFWKQVKSQLLPASPSQQSDCILCAHTQTHPIFLSQATHTQDA